mmetsp:Transcript_16022/g.50342  ORF Transcript_16022/g.50342 Transcript_16022/m.50342 type:complete len:152 (-) Transcript_16022:8-463(-)
MRAGWSRPGSSPGALLSEEAPSPSPSRYGAPHVSYAESSPRGDDLWRVKRRVLGLPPLTPIEETLRQRRQLQTSMSAPTLTLEGLVKPQRDRSESSAEAPPPAAAGREAAPTRPRGLPAELVVRIEDRGWSRRPLQAHGAGQLGATATARG